MLKIVLLSLITALHPVHVSLMSMEYSENSDAFNVFLKIYSDDFLLDYRMLTGDTSKVDFTAANNNAKKIIENYLREKVQVFAEDKRLDSKLVKLDYADGELKLDLVYKNIKKSKNYIVKNFILTDIYKDQSNLLIFRYGNYEEGIKLTSEKLEQTFNVK
jgi:hypothetical protein